MEHKNQGAKEVKEVKSWRIASWNLHGGLMDLIKIIMEVQNKEEEKNSSSGQELSRDIGAQGEGIRAGICCGKKAQGKTYVIQELLGKSVKAKEKKGTKMLTIINVHAPTLASTRENPEVSMGFYRRVNKAKDFHAGKFEDIIIAGDWNAKLGKRASRGKGRFSMGMKIKVS